MHIFMIQGKCISYLGSNVLPFLSFELHADLVCLWGIFTQVCP